MRPARRSARRTAIVLGVAFLGACGQAPVAHAQEELLQELKTVASVQILGRRHLSAGAIRKVLKTRGKSVWPWRDRPALRFDYVRADVAAIRQLYRHHGFLDADVAARVSSAGPSGMVEVTFAIREGERSRVGAVRFEGVAIYPEAELRKKIWARPGRPFDPAYLQLDTLIISTLYQQRGYRPHVSADFDRGDPDSTRIQVIYGVQEGQRYRVGEVTVSGHDRVRDRLITRELLLKPGTFYSLSRVQRSQERLYETGLFSQVQIEPLPDSTHTMMNFDVRLRERKPRWLDAGVGSGTDERFRLVGEWGHRNVAGQGLQGVISTRLTFSADPYAQAQRFMWFQRWHVEGSLIEPWLLRTRTRGIVTPFYERYDDRADTNWVVRQEFKGINFQLRRELNRFTRLTLSQENVFARQELEIRAAAAVDSAQRDSLSKTAEPDYTTHRIALGVERDLRDNPFTPTRGSAIRLVAEVAGGPLRGTSSFQKYEAGASWYTPLPNGWILATRAAGGLINPFGPRPTFSPVLTTAGASVDSQVARVPLEDRFRTGGVNTIRGYDENAVSGSGGLALVLASAELRIPTPVRVPFLGTLGFEAYVDAGNVWARPEYVRWSHFTDVVEDDPNTVRAVAGFGPRLDLPVGPLRIDVTWRWRPLRSHYIIQFAIGPSF